MKNITGIDSPHVEMNYGNYTLQNLDLQGGNATLHAFLVRELFTE